MTDLPATWEVDGWRLHLEKGRKGDDDVRIGVASPGGDYQVLRLSSLGAIARLWYANEERLYPPPRFKGGKFMLEFLQACCETDLKSACKTYGLKAPDIKRLDETQSPKT